MKYFSFLYLIHELLESYKTETIYCRQHKFSSFIKTVFLLASSQLYGMKFSSSFQNDEFQRRSSLSTKFFVEMKNFVSSQGRCPTLVVTTEHQIWPLNALQLIWLPVETSSLHIYLSFKQTKIGAQYFFWAFLHDWLSRHFLSVTPFIFIWSIKNDC